MRLRAPPARPVTQARFKSGLENGWGASGSDEHFAGKGGRYQRLRRFTLALPSSTEHTAAVSSSAWPCLRAAA
jgi:hypothetical protein